MLCPVATRWCRIHGSITRPRNRVPGYTIELADIDVHEAGPRSAVIRVAIERSLPAICALGAHQERHRLGGDGGRGTPVPMYRRCWPYAYVRSEVPRTARGTGADGLGAAQKAAAARPEGGSCNTPRNMNAKRTKAQGSQRLANRVIADTPVTAGPLFAGEENG